MNPGLSLKDRTALFIVEAAERSARSRPGGTIVEGTAGNTGIGLAMIAAVKGYRCILVIPNTMAREKVDIIRGFGAEVQLVEKKPWDDPCHYNKITERSRRRSPARSGRTSSTTTPTRGALRDDGAGDLGADRRSGGRLPRRDGDGGHRRRGGTVPARGVREGLREGRRARGARRTRIIAVDPSGSVYRSFFKTCEPEGRRGLPSWRASGSARCPATTTARSSTTSSTSPTSAPCGCCTR
jgi:cysteine synthase